MAKQRPSAQKREREYQKRQREQRKAEKAAQKREKREGRTSPEGGPPAISNEEAAGDFTPPGPGQ